MRRSKCRPSNGLRGCSRLFLTAQNHTGQLSRVSYTSPQGEGCLHSRALVTFCSTLHHSTIEVASRGRVGDLGVTRSWTAMECYRGYPLRCVFAEVLGCVPGCSGERLTVGIMLPGAQEADDWLNFMLSQKNLWPTFTTRGTLNEEISAQVSSKERKRLQAFHLWMDVKLRWGVLLDRMYVTAPTGKSEAELDALLFDKVARRNRKKKRRPWVTKV